ASRERSLMSMEDGIHVHRIQTAVREDFTEQIAPVFVRRHTDAPFDVLEGPDYNADAEAIVRLVPDIPLVVRLHTPKYLAASLYQLSLQGSETDRQDAATWREWLQPLPGYDPEQDPEYQHVRQADGITAPSKAIREVMCRDWRLERDQVDVVPNV